MKNKKTKFWALLSVVLSFFHIKNCSNDVAPIVPVATIQHDTITVKVIDTVFVPKPIYTKYPKMEDLGEWVLDVENPSDTVQTVKDSIVYVIVKDSIPVNFYCDTLKSKYTTSIVKMEVQGEILNYSQVTTIEKVPPELIPICEPCPVVLCKKKHKTNWIKKLFEKWKLF